MTKETLTHFIFLGAPGSGKGTQAKLLAEKYNCTHISTGDLFRQEIAKGTELGKKVESILSAGQLVDDETVLELLQLNFERSEGRCIFDGYPRNLDQAKSLDQVVLKSATRLAVYFKVDVDQLVTRLVSRRVCKGCGAIWNQISRPTQKEGICDICGSETIHRSDDKEEVIRDRMGVYQEQIDPILDFYKQDQSCEVIDASAEMTEVTKQLHQLVEGR